MFPTMNIRVTRRNLLQSFTVLAAGAASGAGAALVGGPPVRAQAVAASGKPSPIRLGLTSSTFRTFSRAQLIAYMEQFNVLFLSCSNMQDHLPMDPTEETRRSTDYASAGILLHAAGAHRVHHRCGVRHPRKIRLRQARRHQPHRRRSHTRHAAAHRQAGPRVRHPRCRPQPRRQLQLPFSIRCPEGHQGPRPAHWLLYRHGCNSSRERQCGGGHSRCRQTPL